MTIRRVQKTPRAGGRGLLAILKLTAQWLFGRPSLYGIPASCPVLGLGETVYNEPWEPAGLATGPAAALLANWKASKREEEWRRLSLAKRAARILSVNRTVLVPPGGVSGLLRLPVPPTDCMDEARMERLGIVRGYPQALSVLAIPGGRRFGSSRCEGAEELASVLYTVPTHSRAVRSPAYPWSVGPAESEFPDADGSTPSEPT
jgi:hypothetical protein